MSITQVRMRQTKQTKGCVVYQAAEGFQEATLQTIYLKKKGLPNPAPEFIIVKVESADG